MRQLGASTNSVNNRIIQGDNLEVLKGLIPQFEQQVDCIYFYPPYNTGADGWRYNEKIVYLK